MFFNKRIQKHLLKYSYLPISPKGLDFLEATHGSVDLSLFNYHCGSMKQQWDMLIHSASA